MGRQDFTSLGSEFYLFRQQPQHSPVALWRPETELRAIQPNFRNPPRVHPEHHCHPFPRPFPLFTTVTISRDTVRHGVCEVARWAYVRWSKSNGMQSFTCGDDIMNYVVPNISSDFRHWIRTRDRGKRAAVILRLRPRGY
jgi:hypothetical protein